MFSCVKEQKTDYIILRGKVEKSNYGINSFTIENSNYEKLKIVKICDDNTFLDTLKLQKKGIYNMRCGQNRNQIYLEPGNEIEILLDCKNNRLVFTGDVTFENKYLFQKELLSDSLKKIENYKYYGQLEENDYLSLSDSLYNLKISLFKKFANTFDYNFKFIEKNTIKYQHLNNQNIYESIRQLVTDDKKFKVSSGYYTNLYKGIDLSGKDLTKIPYYVNFVSSYIWQLTNERFGNNDSKDMDYLSTIEIEIKNKKFKEDLAFNYGEIHFVRASNLDNFYVKIKTMISSPDRLKILEKKYQRLKKIQKGAVSPSFKLENKNGKIVSLEDLKGSYVYIDIWSPYCLPCMAEILYLKKTEKYFHNKNISFVCICVGETKTKWEKMIQDKNLTGIQLFALNERISFFRDYMVHGIPRFILIDKEGKIINSSAKRPSDPKLKEELNKLL